MIEETGSCVGCLLHRYCCAVRVSLHFRAIGKIMYHMSRGKKSEFSTILELDHAAAALSLVGHNCAAGLLCTFQTLLEILLWRRRFRREHGCMNLMNLRICTVCKKTDKLSLCLKEIR